MCVPLSALALQLAAAESGARSRVNTARSGIPDSAKTNTDKSGNTTARTHREDFPMSARLKHSGSAGNLGDTTPGMSARHRGDISTRIRKEEVLKDGVIAGKLWFFFHTPY